MLEELGPKAPEPHIAIHLRNRIPLRRGLGSSASAIVAGLALADALEHGAEAVNRARIARRASEIEGHPDNATPAVYGGFCIGDGTGFERIPMSDRLYLLVVPDLEIETEAARHALPQQVPLQDAVYNLQRAALSAVRIARSGDLSGAAPFEDKLHQRHRLGLDARLGGLYDGLKAHPTIDSVFLSGSGSTLLAIPKHPVNAEKAARELLDQAQVGGKVLLARADERGLVVLQR
jgi:homoserine kinase